MLAPSEIREEVVREGNIGRPKMPFRRWKTQPRPNPATKIEFSPKIDEIVPIQVKIEVQAGRDASANSVRAYRVLKQLEESGHQARSSRSPAMAPHSSPRSTKLRRW